MECLQFFVDYQIYFWIFFASTFGWIFIGLKKYSTIAGYSVLINGRSYVDVPWLYKIPVGIMFYVMLIGYGAHFLS